MSRALERREPVRLAPRAPESPRRRVGLTFVFVCGLVYFVAASAVHGASGWSAPIRVAPWGADPVAVPVPGDGQIVFDESRSTGKRLLAVRRSGTSFSRPRRLSDVRSEVVRFGADGRGNILIVAHIGGGSRTRVLVERQSPSGRRSRLQTVRPGHEIGSIELAVSRSGTAVLAWPARTRRGWRVEAVIRRPGRNFGSPRALSRPRRAYPTLVVATGDRGDAVVAWHWEREEGGLLVGALGALHAAIASPAGRWSREQAIGDGGETNTAAISVSPAGRMLAAWIPTYYGERSDREPSRLMIAERAPAARFTPARTLTISTPGFIEDGGPVVRVADNGRALIAWVRPAGETAFGSGQADLEAFTRSTGGEFVSQDLTAASVAPKFPILAAGPDGTVALGWTEEPLAETAKARLLFSVGTIGSPLPAPSAVSARAHDVVWPTAAVTSGGDVLAAWVIGPLGSGPIRAAVYSR